MSDPERVASISIDCTFEINQVAATSSRVHGEFVRPERWGIRRRGRLTVEGAGTARASLNAALSHLAACRPGTAAVRGALMGIIPTFIIIVAVGIGSVLIPVAASDRAEAPAFFGRTTLTVYSIDAVVAVLYYGLIGSFFSGTRVVEPATVASRSWLTPEVVASVIGLLIAGTALFAPAISAVVAIAVAVAGTR